MVNLIGSAGAPILNVLLKQNLSNVLAIVTRYFGGTLLGIGGLVNSYTSVCYKSIRKSKIY
jgi:putative IMPACT (imprinted ancient) family translation regulator